MLRTRALCLLASLVVAPVWALQGAPAAQVWSNSLGMRFVRIPAGSFQRGSDDAPHALAQLYPLMEPERLALLGDEAPVRRTLISRDFWLGQHEVTVAQFGRFIARSGYVPESVADGTGGYGWRAGYDAARGDAFEGRDVRYSWRSPGFAQTGAHPVVNVTWNDAQALAAWLSRTEGRRYRLPTEAEWEYACRAAGATRRYPQGNTPRSLVGSANVFDARSAQLWPHWAHQALPVDDGFAFTAPVGSFAPNALSLYDMAGNVWEWVADWYADDAYATAPAIDPSGPPTGAVRVRRGGSWHTWPLYARCTYRNWNAPATRYVLVGIRLVREVDARDVAPLPGRAARRSMVHPHGKSAPTPLMAPLPGDTP